jgi:hypothetical protein
MNEEPESSARVKVANAALKIYEPEWLLVNLIRQKRNALARDEVARLEIFIEPANKDIIILDAQVSKRIVLAAA